MYIIFPVDKPGTTTLPPTTTTTPTTTTLYPPGNCAQSKVG